MEVLHRTARTAFSTRPTVTEAVAELREALAGVEASTVIVFASPAYDAPELAGAMEAAFTGAAVFGCTTAGELVADRMLKHAVVAMAFDAATLADVQVQVVRGLRAGADIAPAFQGFEAHFGTPMAELDHSTHVGLVLMDGLSGAEERLMDRIGDLTNVTFIGGSAGDDLKFERTHVFAGGQALTDAAVLVLIRPTVGFEIIKTQSFNALERKLLVTDADEATRTVRAFNGKPASEAYAEAVGCEPADGQNHFMSHPVGLMANGEIFVRSPQQVKGTDMVFYCNVLNGMELALLEATDIISDTRAALAAKLAETGPVAGLINFHCILRTLELEQKGLTEAYGQVFSGVPSIGFSTYGEAYIGHINQTSTILLFK